MAERDFTSLLYLSSPILNYETLTWAQVLKRDSNIDYWDLWKSMWKQAQEFYGNGTAAKLTLSDA